MSYLTLTKKIIQEDLSDEDLIKYLDTPNIPVIQQTILKIIKKDIKDEDIRSKLFEYSGYMEDKFKILGACKLGHLAIYALKKLNYLEDFQAQYKKISDYDKELVAMIEEGLKDIT